MYTIFWWAGPLPLSDSVEADERGATHTCYAATISSSPVLTSSHAFFKNNSGGLVSSLPHVGMNEAPSSLLWCESGAPVHFRAARRMVITTMEIGTTLPPLLTSDTTATFSLPPSGTPSLCGSVVVWALVLPRLQRLSADRLYAHSPPLALGVVNMVRDGTPELAYLPLTRWVVEAGSTVWLALTNADSTAEAVGRQFDECRAAVRGKALASSPTSTSPTEKQSGGLCLFIPATFSLTGMQLGELYSTEEHQWHPLLVHRWFELKNYVRASTVVEPPSASQRAAVQKAPTSSGAPPWRMYQGDVKAAVAVSANGGFVRWEDGSTGLMDELKVFYREYTPARQEKVVRVRRYPHRYADVVGEVPFGSTVKACGRATDPFTGEVYALLYLLPGEAYRHMVETYELQYVSAREGWLWGWSKIAGRQGLPFLVEVDGAARKERETTAVADQSSPGSQSPLPPLLPGSHGRGQSADSATAAPTTVSESETDLGFIRVKLTKLPPRSFFTSVREGKGVRIRAEPSLHAVSLAELEPNEVKEAVALLRVPIAATAAAPPPTTDVTQPSAVQDTTEGSSAPSPSPPNAGATAPKLYNEFVKWRDGGYSLVCNPHQTYLVPVNVTDSIRRFPVRARRSSSGTSAGVGRHPFHVFDEGGNAEPTVTADSVDGDADGDGEDEEVVIPLYRVGDRRGLHRHPSYSGAHHHPHHTRRCGRRRAREEEEEGEEEEGGGWDSASSDSFSGGGGVRGGGRGAAQDTLWSPRQVPQSVWDGIRSGRIRLDQLPRADSTADEEEDEEVYDDSADFDEESDVYDDYSEMTSGDEGW